VVTKSETVHRTPSRCECCGHWGWDVHLHVYQGETEFVCDSYEECVARATEKLKIERKKEANLVH
jgi:hypothetical protein